MTKSQQYMVNILKDDGWEFVNIITVIINNCSYGVVKMKRKGICVLINTQGGFKGKQITLANM